MSLSIHTRGEGDRLNTSALDLVAVAYKKGYNVHLK